VIESLQKIKIPIYYVSLRTFADIPRSVERLAVLAGTAVSAAAAVRELDARVAKLPKAPSKPAPLGVFYMMLDSPLYTVGSRHLMTDAIARCGGRNLYADIDFPAPIVEFEDIKKRNPDVILMEAQPITARDWRERWSRFPSVKAVANRQLLPFVDARLNRMGPSAIDGVEGLCKLLRNVPR
jgi:iron complex transport system substrate-binding protein